MPTPDDLDRTQELPAEPLDDLAPLESRDSSPVPRPERIKTISCPLPLDSNGREEDRQIARELASGRISIARREQRHRHAMELAELRHRHEQRLARRRLEGRILAAVLMLVVASGLAWISLPKAEAAQVVFTTCFGAVAGYLGARKGPKEREGA